MDWKLKSESDTDRVWAEVDRKGRETGVYEYELGLSLESRTVGARRPRRRWPLYAGGAVVLIAATVDVALRLT